MNAITSRLWEWIQYLFRHQQADEQKQEKDEITLANLAKRVKDLEDKCGNIIAPHSNAVVQIGPWSKQ